MYYSLSLPGKQLSKSASSYESLVLVIGSERRAGGIIKCALSFVSSVSKTTQHIEEDAARQELKHFTRVGGASHNETLKKK